jgi:hypothetical protein
VNYSVVQQFCANESFFGRCNYAISEGQALRHMNAPRCVAWVSVMSLTSRDVLLFLTVGTHPIIFLQFKFVCFEIFVILGSSTSPMILFFRNTLKCDLI